MTDAPIFGQPWSGIQRPSVETGPWRLYTDPTTGEPVEERVVVYRHEQNPILDFQEIERRPLP